MSLPYDTASIAPYDFFFRGQTIFKAGRMAGQIYAVLAGQVAIYQAEQRLAVVGPGQFLAEITLPKIAGLAAVAYTNCRLVAVDPVMFATLAQYPPGFVLAVLRGKLKPSPAQAPAQVTWPASFIAGRTARKLRRLRETAAVIETRLLPPTRPVPASDPSQANTPARDREPTHLSLHQTRQI